MSEKATVKLKNRLFQFDLGVFPSSFLNRAGYRLRRSYKLKL